MTLKSFFVLVSVLMALICSSLSNNIPECDHLEEGYTALNVIDELALENALFALNQTGRKELEFITITEAERKFEGAETTDDNLFFIASNHATNINPTFNAIVHVENKNRHLVCFTEEIDI